MKPIITMLAIATAMLQTHASVAAVSVVSPTATCTKTTCGSSDAYTTNLCYTTNYSAVCYKNSATETSYRIFSCASCPSGYELKDVSISDIVPGSGCLSSDTAKQCCKTCTDCASDTAYTATGTNGYLSKKIRSCSCSGTCSVTSTKYMCAPGYYGRSTDGTSGCTRCPKLTNTVYGTTDVNLSLGDTVIVMSTITNCYIPANTPISSTSGTYHFTEDCYYDNDSFTIIGGIETL
ncbi:MAG: hypothetical protein NC311_05180 [Muribaculaceae bacterium]|nr:hypothetical protein [Muribaculaceae bacterium]